MGKKQKYGFEKNFTRLLNGRYPFFVVRLYGHQRSEVEKAIREELVKVAGDGFHDMRFFYYLLKISCLIQKQLIPDAAMFIDKYFDANHCLVFCKCCIESISEIYEVLEKEALGNYRWKLVTFVANYEELGLVFPRFLYDCNAPCPLPGHPAHDTSTSTNEADSDQTIRSELTTDGQSGEKDSAGAGCDEADNTAPNGSNKADNTAPNGSNKRNFEVDWEPVEEALLKLYLCNPEQVDEMFDMQGTYFKGLQRHLAEMVEHDRDWKERIYKQLKQSLLSRVLEIDASIAKCEGHDFWRELSKNWDSFFSQIFHMLHLFNSVGTSFLQPVKLGLSIWQKYILESGNVMTRMAIHIRSESDVQHELMIELIKMLDVYSSESQHFEMEFVELSRALYETDSEKIGSDCRSITCTFSPGRTREVDHLLDEYIHHFDEVLDIELKLAGSYLSAKGQALLLDAIHEHYLIKHSCWLQSCLMSSIVYNEDYALVVRVHSVLSRLPIGSFQMDYWLVSIVEGILGDICRDGVANEEHLRWLRQRYDQFFADYVTNDKSLEQDVNTYFKKTTSSSNMSIVEGSSGDLSRDDVAIGEHILLLRQRYDRLFADYVTNDKSLEQAVNTYFKKTIISSKKCARCLTAYIDSRLRQTVTVQTQQDIDVAFQFVVKYVNGAAFRLLYWHYMADRLIKMVSSHKAEEELIERLKVQYGSAFTEKLEQMLHEMKSQQNISEEFNSMFPNECPSTSFILVDSRYWPVEQLETYHLPRDVQPIIEKIEAYLRLKGYSSKKIWWQGHLGSATLVVTSSNGQRHEVVVTTPQMSIIVLFNSADSLTYWEIQEATGMTDADLKPCLWSLISADATSVLTMKKNVESELALTSKCSLASGEIQEATYMTNVIQGPCSSASVFAPEMSKILDKLFEDSIFSFNEQFSGHMDLSQKHEFKTGILFEVVDEAEKYHIDAAIVRIMKKEKYIDLSRLLVAVTNALQPFFTTTSAAIEGRIEELIKKEYLEKDPGDSNCYRYI